MLKHQPITANFLENLIACNSMKFDLGCCTTYFFFTIARASVSCCRPTHPSARYRSALAGILPLIIFLDWPFTFLRLVQPLEMSLQPLAKILVEALIALQLGFGDYFFICYSVIIHHKNNRSADDCQQNAWRSQGSTLSFLAGTLGPVNILNTIMFKIIKIKPNSGSVI